MRASSQILDAVAEDYIAKRLFWHGRITRRDVMQALEVASAKATNLLIDFRERYRGQLLEERKGYAPTTEFQPAGVSGDQYLEELLNALQRQLDPVRATGERTSARIPQLFRKQVKTEVLREVLRALRDYQAITIVYVGMARGAQATERTVEPVELVYINDRWHLRAFCYQAAGWRDFVLSRILSVNGFEPARFKWLKTGNYRQPPKTSIFIPHPDLTDDQKAVVAFEFRMENGRLELQLAEDDLFYFIEHYVAKENEGPPQKVLVTLTS